MLFVSNKIRTSQYTWWSFVPHNLFQQFCKASNLYYLIITFMQMSKMISYSNGSPAMLPPLVVVVAASMVKDAYEDFKRHTKD